MSFVSELSGPLEEVFIVAEHFTVAVALVCKYGIHDFNRLSATQASAISPNYPQDYDSKQKYLLLDCRMRHR